MSKEMTRENLKFLKKFVKDFNSNFCPPFIEKGLAKAKITDGVLWIQIDRRDVSFSLETGECVAAGTCI